MNKPSSPRSAGPAGRRAAPAYRASSSGGLAARIALLAALSLAAALAAASCSAVFRSSIQGTVIDQEAWADGTTAGVSDAKVFLYTDRAARDEDFSAYVAGDESTLPDGLAEQRYFQSTVTDANGAYDFTGFIWESFFSAYGKTADRTEVHILVYHPDYGLWRNPVPLYVVSDVTNQLDYLKITDLWNQGRLAGTVLDWKDGKAMANAAVTFYVAKSWAYDEAGAFKDVVYPNAPTASTTSDADGRWAATVRFPMMPNRADDKAKGPVRIVFSRANYRANDPFDGTDDLANAGLVVDIDLDRDGAKANQGDYEDAYIEAALEYDAAEREPTLKTIPAVTLQRWSFSASVSGRVVEDGVTPAVGVDGVTVELTIGSETFSADTAPTDTANSTESGRFNIGTVTWELSDISDLAKRKTGEVDVTMGTVGATYVSGALTSLKPDTQRSVTLKVTP